MGILEHKKGIVMGVANDKSLAAGIARSLHQQGASLIFSHLPDQDNRTRMADRVKSVAEPLASPLIFPCDVTDSSSLDRFFEESQKIFPTIDFLIHSIAYAPIDDIRCPVRDVSKDGFHQAMEISVYSLLEVARRCTSYLSKGGSICTLTYFGGEKVIPGYNLMGICKSALDASVRYLAAELGPLDIRINAVSAGPIRTLASSAVKDFKSMLSFQGERSPIRRNINQDDVGGTVSFLLSSLAGAITGEIVHVDCGYHILGA